jgi:hypothetical protein
LEKQRGLQPLREILEPEAPVLIIGQEPSRKDP